jgi:hypothetical protein
MDDDRADELKSLCASHSVGFEIIGRTGGDRVSLGESIDVSVKEASEEYYRSLEALVEGESYLT